MPSKKGRAEILQIHTRHMPLTQEVDIEKLAAVTHGFVACKLLEGLCKEAAMKTLRRVLPEAKDGRSQVDARVFEQLRTRSQMTTFKTRCGT